MAQTTYGSITIVDITDVGQLSVYPTSNMPLSIIYDPDQNIYTPNWSATNLTLTPVIYYNNQTLTATTTGVTVTWRRREGIGNISALTTGEQQLANGNLSVTANKFTSSSTMLTYIVSVSYVEPDTQQTLTAEGQITFSLVKLASSAKTCIISGNSVFKYNSAQRLVSDSTIVLTAKLNNVSIQEWQYKNSLGNWVTYPNSTTSETLTVNATDTVFTNDVVTIQLLTNDPNVYDIHTITNLRDGAAGSATVSAVLTNEDQMIPYPSNGSPDFSQAISQIIIYNGGTTDTQNWTITQSNSSNLTTTVSTTVQTNDTVHITGMTGDTGTVTFTCQRANYADIIKTFSVIKITSGVDGHDPEIYSLECDTLAVNGTTPSDNSQPTYTPSSFDVRAYLQVGNGLRQAYAGRIKITSGNTNIHNVSTNESNYTVTSSNIATAATNGYMTVELYQAGGTTTLLDKQTIVITSDGAKGDPGQQGSAGVDAINVIIGNQADVIPCSASNALQAQFVIDIPFSGYKGTTQVACTVSTPPTILGITPVVTQATATSIGHIVYTIPQGTTVANSSGEASFTFSCEGQTAIHSYRWTRSTAAINGENAKLFELYTPNGNVFTSRDSQNITIIGRIMDGNTDATSSATNWVWEQFINGAYTTITTEAGKYTVNGSQLTVNNSAVDGYASFKCSCRYSGVTYTAYYVLLDKLDPIQCTVLSSIGSQIINGQGIGALYVIVTDTGSNQELDALKSDTFSTTPPTNPTTGDFYYHLNDTAKTVVLKKYNGSAWTNAESADLPTGTYTWSFRDKDGDPYNHASLATSGKVIYIDGTMITKKITADVRVEI